MKRLSPAACVIVVVAGLLLVADAAFLVAPAALADQASPPPIVADASATASQTPILYVRASGSVPLEELPSALPYDPADFPTAPPTPTPTPTPVPKPTAAPTPRDTVWNARIYAKAVLGDQQYGCVYDLFQMESKWDPTASSGSGAYGIPQAVPGSKMAAFGPNWRYSPLIQVKWGIWYVNSRYGSACNAWAFWQVHGWY